MSQKLGCVCSNPNSDINLIIPSNFCSQVHVKKGSLLYILQLVPAAVNQYSLRSWMQLVIQLRFGARGPH